MHKYHDAYGHIQEKKRVYIDYLKEISDFRALR